MPALAFICTRPDAWDPFCHTEQLILLFLVGAAIGVVATRYGLRRIGGRPGVVSVLLQVVGCLIGAVVVISIGFQFSS